MFFKQKLFYTTFTLLLCTCFSSCELILNSDDDDQRTESYIKLVTPVHDTPFGNLTQWVFISDSKGGILQEILLMGSGEKEYQVFYPGKEKKVLMTIVDVIEYQSSTEIELNTYPVNLEETLHLPKITLRRNFGKTKVTINNISELNEDTPLSDYSIQFDHSNGALEKKTIDNKSLIFDVSLYKLPVDALLVNRDAVQPTYKFVEKVNTNKVAAVDFSSFLPMEGKLQYNLPHEEWMAWLNGKIEDGNSVQNYNLGFIYETSEDKSIYFPEEVFNSFESNIIAFKENSSFYNYTIGLPINSFTPLDVTYTNFKSSENNFSFTSTGKYDAYRLVYRKIIEENGHKTNIWWYISGQGGNTISGVIPEIPESLSRDNQFLSNENLEARSVSFIDYNQFDFSGYMNAFFSDQNESMNKGFNRATYSLLQNNGRYKNGWQKDEIFQELFGSENFRKQ